MEPTIDHNRTDPMAATAQSTALERDARVVNSREDHDARPGEIAIGVIIGRTSEFFDFFVYALASVIVFPAYVFPYLDRFTATVWSFAIFPLAFVARPIGTQIFMRVDRLYGRGTKLTIALFLLGTATCAVAFLPGYAQVGSWSAILLAVFRIGQGIALALAGAGADLAPAGHLLPDETIARAGALGRASTSSMPI